MLVGCLSAHLRSSGTSGRQGRRTIGGVLLPVNERLNRLGSVAIVELTTHKDLLDSACHGTY